MSGGTGAGRFDAREPMHELCWLGWAERQWLRRLDTAFADFLWREVPEAPPFLILAAALASHQLGRGHACLDLAATLKAPAFALSLPPEGALPGSGAADALDPPPLPAEVFAGLSLGQWQQALAQPLLVGAGAGNTAVGMHRRAPLSAPLLAIRAGRARRDRAPPGDVGQSAGLRCRSPRYARRSMRSFRRLRLPCGRRQSTGRKIACALAARSGFSIITGGPGTGKTTTVVSLLALLQALALERAASAQSSGHGGTSLAHSSGSANGQGRRAAQRVDRQRCCASAAGRPGARRSGARGDPGGGEHLASPAR
jgi:exodeoxyribonuclease V alpha subunit